MANTTTTLLTKDEIKALYQVPMLDDTERTECFTFNAQEIKYLNNFDRIEYAVYYAISLAFFKLKYTLIDFRYRDVTLERQHVMQRYFPNKPAPRGLPDDKDVIKRIENKVLNTVGFARFRDKSAKNIISTLQKQAPTYPHQRQLCKALLQLMIKERITIPAITSIQDCVSQIWNAERARIIRCYYRNTLKTQRDCVLSLLEKTDDHHRIVSIKKDMKEFNTASIDQELEKHERLKSVFLIAKVILPISVRHESV